METLFYAKIEHNIKISPENFCITEKSSKIAKYYWLSWSKIL